MNVIQGKTIAVREVETYGANAKPLSPREIETCGVNAKPLSPKKIDFCEMNVKSPANVRAVVSNAREPRLQQIVPIEPEEKAVNQLQQRWLSRFRKCLWRIRDRGSWI